MGQASVTVVMLFYIHLCNYHKKCFTYFKDERWDQWRALYGHRFHESQWISWLSEWLL